MKKIIFVFVCLLVANYSNAQVSDANYIVDYSKAIICGMDEESFAELELDWYKDRPEITGGLIEGIMDKLGKTIPFKKSSRNTVKVTVISITDNGKFNCNIELFDSNGRLMAQARNIRCSKGGTWGSKLHLMKESTEKEGKKLGAALKKEIKK